MRNPETVRKMINAKTSGNGIGVTLNHGPFDGLVLKLQSKFFLQIARDDEHFAVELNEDATAVAIYRLECAEVSKATARFAYYGSTDPDCGE